MLYDHPFDTMERALHNLRECNVMYTKGIIILNTNNSYPPQLLNACDYLCDEWDYAIEWINK